MREIKCTCGEVACTTTIKVERVVSSVNVVIEHKNTPTNNRLDVGLDANGIVQLIKELKLALLDITNISL